MTHGSRIVCLTALAFLSAPALAADRAPPLPRCEAIDAMKTGVKGAKFTVLTPGQFHFMAGVYVASPLTPPGGMPPGDGAILIETNNKAAIIWTRGKQACITQIVIDAEHHVAAYMPLPVGGELLSILRQVKTGADETFAPDDSSEDRKL